MPTDRSRALATGVAAIALAALTGCGPKVECVDADLAKYAPTIEEVPAAERSDFALRLLAQACPEPAGLAKYFGDWRLVPPDQRPPVIGRTVAEHASLWNTGCPGGKATFEALARSPEEQRTAILFEQCEMGRFGWVTPENVNPETAIIGLLYAPVLEKAGASQAVRDHLLRPLLTR